MITYDKFKDLLLDGCTVEVGNCEYKMGYGDELIYRWLDNPNINWYNARCSLPFLYAELSTYHPSDLMSIYKSKRYIK